MPFRYVDHLAGADAAFEAWGGDLDELFFAAAEATLSVMIKDLGVIAAKTRRQISLQEEAVDLLLYEWLQELIYYKDAEMLLLRPVKTDVIETSEGYELTADTVGEKIDPERHELLMDVKAVTFHDLTVTSNDGVWVATIVLDI